MRGPVCLLVLAGSLCVALATSSHEQCTNPDCAGAPGTVIDLGAFKTLQALKEAYKDKLLLTKLFAPWCGHCKAMAETWVAVAAAFKDVSDVAVGEIDCTEHQNLCSEAGVRGYPTILAFSDGKEAGKHSGPRTIDGFRTWVKKLQSAAKEPASSGDAAAPSPGVEHVPGKVLALDPATFKAAIASQKLTVVKLFAPWCGHCKRMAPAWEDLAQQLAGNADVVVSELDCDKHQAACEEAKVEGYPTVKAFKGGQDLGEHLGGRDVASLKAWVAKLSGGSAGGGASKGRAAGKAAGGADDDEYADGLDDEEDEDEDHAAAQHHDDDEGDHEADDDDDEYADGDDDDNNAAGGAAPAAEAATVHTPGKVLTLGNKSFKPTISSAKLTLVKMFAPWCGHCKAMAPAWVELAKDVKGNADVIIAELDCTVHKDACDEGGADGFPTIKAFKDGKDLGEHMGGRDLASLKDWIAKLSGSGAAEEEEVAEEEAAAPAAAAAPHTPGEVLALGDASFKATAAASKLMLVKAFAPWCGHCKAMAPAWAELAKAVKDNADVIIAELDCTVHKDTCQSLKVRGYPTVLAFKQGVEAGKHSGPRDVASFKTWIDKLLGSGGSETDTERGSVADAGTAATHTPGEVLALTDANFKATVATPKLTLVKLFAPWCGHCKAMAAAWVELAKTVKDNADVVVAEVDCTVHKAACESAGAEGYPTIKAFKDGKDLGEHEGRRDVASLVAFAKAKL